MLRLQHSAVCNMCILILVASFVLREAFDAITDASSILLKHGAPPANALGDAAQPARTHCCDSLMAGDYHAHTDTREQMQQRFAEDSAASSSRRAQPPAAEASADAESSDDMEEVRRTECCKLNIGLVPMCRLVS